MISLLEKLRSAKHPYAAAVRERIDDWLRRLPPGSLVQQDDAGAVRVLGNDEARRVLTNQEET